MLETSSSIRMNLLLTGALVALIGGSAMAWSVYTQLEGAVIAQGVVVVEGRIKTVQHPSGGVIGSLLVQEGQLVRSDELLLRLDDTATRTNLAIIVNELVTHRVRLARMRAEVTAAEDLVLSRELMALLDKTPEAPAVIDGERALMQMRRKSRKGEQEQLTARIGQTREEIAGLYEQLQSVLGHLRINEKELQDIKSLARRNLVQRPRLTSLEREVLSNQGTAGDLKARIAQAEGRIGEVELQIGQIDRALITEVTTQMRETEMRIRELEERRTTAEDSLRRVDVRAPIAGRVHQLAVHTVGGVVTPSEPLMLIVPEDAQLIIEAHVDPVTIDQPTTGQRTRVRLTAFDRQSTPELEGELYRISADLTRDSGSNPSYYLAGIRLSAGELERLGGLTLIPGMPAEVYIKTAERTPASYMLKPFKDQMQRALRER